MAIEASAPGKAILFGEHSVVYRGPAVVLAIDKRARVVAQKRNDDRVFLDALDLGFAGYFEEEKYHAVVGERKRGRSLAAFNTAAVKTMEHLGVESGVSLSIRSDIPIAAGLGSSAAVSVATVAAIGALLGGGLPKDEVCSLAYEGEKVVHGTPSGVDNNISTYGGILKFEKDVGFEKYKLDNSPVFIIGNTRRKRSTRRMVEKVRLLRNRNKQIVDTVIDAIGNIAVEGLAALNRTDLETVGDLMDINHGLLASLGVSSPDLELMVHASRRSGALGSKLTGAGGGGCMIALTEDASIQRIQRAIRRRGGESIIVNISQEGVVTREIG